jgi:uncharacterized protein
MQRDRDTLVYAATDLIQYSQSPFASWMDRLELERSSNLSVPASEDDLLVALRQLGEVHEKKFLRSLETAKADIYYIDHRGDYDVTIKAMKAGHAYIYQAAMRKDSFVGYADFLVRVATPSALGSWSYVPLECKLALNPRPDFVLQACTYCDLLESIQGIRPAEFQVLLGHGEIQIHPTEQYFYYYQQIRQSFLQFMAEFDADRILLPEPGENRHGRWQDYAEKILLDRDHLSQVANITRSQIRKLEAAGIMTLKQLAATNPRRKIPHLDAAVLSRLVTQAKLQQATVETGSVQYQVVAPQPDQPRQGLALLPPSSPLDVYFDMEGYPLASGGLEYLFGAICKESHPSDAGKVLQFYDWWAHDHIQEKRAFEGFIDWVYDRWQCDPSMHIYHYAAYETIAVRRLMGKYATREAQVDDLLRAGVFIDLYQIVRQGVRVGQPSYSIKKLEPLYDCDRSGEVQTAADSVLQYFRWTQSPDGDTATDSKILQEIRDYNRIDCESTKQLVDWLRELQEKHEIHYLNPDQATIEASTAAVKKDPAADLAESLLAALPEDDSSETARIQTLLAHLLQFHQREGKPFWWQRFSWLVADESDLYDELDCLAGLERTDRAPAKPTPKSRSLAYEYRFNPNQETRLEAGTRCWFSPEQGQRECTLHSLDREAGIATISISEKRLKDINQAYPGWEPPRRTSLIDCDFVNPQVLRESVFQTVQQWASSGQLQPALSDFVNRQPPRIHGHRAGQPLLAATEDLLQGTIRVATNLQASTLCIQGPPGSGKTYTAAEIIVRLLQFGKSIAICANSHKVITNLMARVAKLAADKGINFQGAKIGGDRDDAVFQHTSIRFQDQVDKALPPDHQLVGATAYQLSRDSAIGQFDYLFIDEAGQMALANLVAIARCASNLILIGDPMQLEQPLQGSHPGESGQSALNYFLNGQATIPPEMGIFLNTSYRMHPSICQFISEVVYEGKLQPSRHTHNHRVQPLAGGQTLSHDHGILFIPVAHEDNSQSSDEEIQVIATLIAEMVGRPYVSHQGQCQGKIQLEDILIVAPYNLQVRKLQARLGHHARVGTVDKFQGQEAPILIASMCSSRAEMIPRGLQFLLDRHRLNVAISRAQCLSLVVGSPLLAQTVCSTLEQVSLVNLFCKLVAIDTSQY